MLVTTDQLAAVPNVSADGAPPLVAGMRQVNPLCGAAIAGVGSRRDWCGLRRLLLSSGWWRCHHVSGATALAL